MKIQRDGIITIDR